MSEFMKVTVYTAKDVPADSFIEAFAAHLKNKDNWVKPEWEVLTKTAPVKQLAPANEDWWHVRGASLMRKLMIRGPTGVGNFRDLYGCADHRKVNRHHHAKASGSVIRKLLQNLEKLGYVEKAPKGKRQLTPKGRREMDLVARKLKSQPSLF